MYKRGIFQKQRPTTEENIAATAITYFKRFFLHKSLVEVDHPAAIMCASTSQFPVGVYFGIHPTLTGCPFRLAALYTATKIEEVWFGGMLDEIVKAAGTRDPIPIADSCAAHNG